MRIDLVITELDTGGAERCCAELAMYLAARGHRVRLIAIGPRPKSPRDALLLSLETFSKSHPLEIRFLNGRRWWSLLWVLIKLRKQFRRDRPDIIQAFLWHANVLCAALAPRMPIPCVGGVRVAEPRTSRHAWGRWAASRMRKVVCVSQAVADWCQRVEQIEASKLVVIPNGIELSDPTTESLHDHNVPSHAKILLFVGRLELQKGIDLLIDCMPELLQQLPEHHLVLLGDGSWRAAVDSAIGKNGLHGRVHRLGQRSDVRNWMHRSDLFLLPTRYEGMPNVILEAMATGLPVATMQVEGVEELLGENCESQAVEKDRADAWKELVIELARNLQKREHLGQSNRERVEKHFQLKDQLAKYEHLYCQILSLPSPLETGERGRG